MQAPSLLEYGLPWCRFHDGGINILVDLLPQQGLISRPFLQQLLGELGFSYDAFFDQQRCKCIRWRGVTTIISSMDTGLVLLSSAISAPT